MHVISHIKAEEVQFVLSFIGPAELNVLKTCKCRHGATARSGKISWAGEKGAILSKLQY